MIKHLKIHNDEINQIVVEYDYKDCISFWLFDELLDTRTKLGKYSGGKWYYQNKANINKLMQLAKQNPRVRRILFEAGKVVADGDELTIGMQLKCLRRKINIKVTRMFSRLNHN